MKKQSKLINNDTKHSHFDNNYTNIDTILIHGGETFDAVTGAVNIPIYQTSTYKQITLGVHFGYEYSRTGNPTRHALETLIAELENGKYGFAFASGMAAITTVLMLFKSNDKILISRNVYGGTFRVLDKVFSNFNIQYEIVDTENLNAVKSAITENVKAILIESPANPLMTVTDIKAVSSICKEHNILCIVDNTFMTPYLQQPLNLGADIVIHSATKYLSGHSDLLAGLVVVNNENLAKQLAFLQNATGGILQPFDSFLLIRGIKTLGVRMDRHVLNAQKIAEFLHNHNAVKVVHYPGLKSHAGYNVNLKQAKNGGAMIAFELNENYNIVKFFDELKLITLAESLGGVESLICHPSTMTHASIPKHIRESVGITENLIRLSVGIENVDDIINDLNNAINNSKIK